MPPPLSYVTLCIRKPDGTNIGPMHQVHCWQTASSHTLHFTLCHTVFDILNMEKLEKITFMLDSSKMLCSNKLHTQRRLIDELNS